LLAALLDSFSAFSAFFAVNPTISRIRPARRSGPT
jgi:hypothetical protein